jgi:hypothetical protein
LEKTLEIQKRFNEDGLCYFTIKDVKVFVDEDIFDELMKYKWHITNGYVNNKILKLMSRHVMNYSGDLFVDHINNNPLDNRKCNLRILTSKQNAQNTSSRVGSSSQYVGVHKRKNKWCSQITINGDRIYLGTFSSEIESAKARETYIIENKLEFSKLNFPDL